MGMPADRQEPDSPGPPGDPPTPPDPMAVLRSRAYVGLLVVAAVLGVPIAVAAYGFLALVNYLQKELFTHLPHGLGFSTAPAWWPLPRAINGISGPITAPNASDASAANRTPGSWTGVGGGCTPKPAAADGPPLPGKYRMARAASTPPMTSIGSGHQAGAVEKPSPCGRWVNSSFCK